MMAAADPREPRSERVPLSGGAAALIDRVRRLMERAQSIPVVASEELEGDALEPLREETFAAIDEAMSVLSLVLARYERNETEAIEEDFDLGEMCGELERRMDDEGGLARITSVAFVAQLGLRGRRQMLAAVPLDRRWDLIAACSSAVREMLKSASAVELGIAEYEDLPATSRYYVTELERALAVRRAYVRFREDVNASSQASGSRRLRLAASAIAKLVGRPAYAFARVHDRCQIRQFHGRIREQLLEHARVSEPSEVAIVEIASSRVHQDLLNLAELMMQINLRAELRDHDATLLGNVKRDLEGANTNPQEIVTRMRPLLGRDAEIDQILAGRAASPTELRRLVEGCLEGLSRTPDRERRDPEQPPRSQRRSTDHPDRRECDPEV